MEHLKIEIENLKKYIKEAELLQLEIINEYKALESKILQIQLCNLEYERVIMTLQEFNLTTKRIIKLIDK